MAPIVSLSPKQSVFQPLLSVVLTKMRTNKNFSSKTTTCHQVVGGLCLGSIEMDQVAEVMNLITALVPHPTPSSLLLIYSLELIQLDASLEMPVLEEDYSKCGFLVM